MPLADHFHGQTGFARWESFHAAWPIFLLRSLNRVLPARYRAVPVVHLGIHVAPDVTTLDRGSSPSGYHPPTGNGAATAVWAPPEPTATLDVQVPAQDEFAVRVHDALSGERVVATVELVSPANKDRDDHREAFLGKCVGLLQQQVCVALVDVVTSLSANLHAALVDRLGGEPVEPIADGALYATVYRGEVDAGRWRLGVWAYPLAVGSPLPQLPLWLSPDLAVPLDLDGTHAETGRELRLW